MQISYELSPYFFFGPILNISAILFIPLVLTFFNSSTPLLPLASAFLFFSFAAAEPNPFVEPPTSPFDDPLPGRYVAESTEDVVIEERCVLRALNLRKANGKVSARH